MIILGVVSQDAGVGILAVATTTDGKHVRLTAVLIYRRLTTVLIYKWPSEYRWAPVADRVAWE